MKKSLFIIAFVLFLAACSEREPSIIEGSWVRRVDVPDTIQGRCFSETLTIDKSSWRLNVLMHSTYECIQPFLLIEYEGHIADIKQSSDKQRWSMSITDLHLISVTDIVGNDYRSVPKSALPAMNKTFIGDSYKQFNQIIEWHQNKDQMKANLYPAALHLAMTDYPFPQALLSYKRQFSSQ